MFECDKIETLKTTDNGSNHHSSCIRTLTNVECEYCKKNLNLVCVGIRLGFLSDFVQQKVAVLTAGLSVQL
jgi:hypothetical protein